MEAELKAEQEEFERAFSDPVRDLCYVIKYGSLAHIKRLLENGGDANDGALITAVCRPPDEDRGAGYDPTESADIVRLLLAQPGVDINASDAVRGRRPWEGVAPEG